MQNLIFEAPAAALFSKCKDFLRAPMSSTQAHKASLNSNGRRWSKGQFFCVKNGHEVDLDLDLIISIQQPLKKSTPSVFFQSHPIAFLTSAISAKSSCLSLLSSTGPRKVSNCSNAYPNWAGQSPFWSRP